MKLLLALSIALLQAEGMNAQSPIRLAEEGSDYVSSTSSVEQSRDFNKTVVPITKLQSYGPVQRVNFGTGFCIDPDCRFIGTNYHVAKLMGKHFKVKGSPVVNRWLGTGSDDDEASKNRWSGPLGRILPREKYAQIRDIAVVELRWPLSKKGYHGLPFSNDDLQYGQEVFIYSFPFHWDPKRKLERFKAKFLGYNVKYSNRSLEDLSDKPLLFNYDPADGKITGGASGGLVVDGWGRVVGILNAKAEQIDHTVAAVPVPVFSAFLSRIQPYLSTQLFPKSVVIPPVSADSYPEWVPPPRSGHLEHRPVEPPEVQALRAKATVLADTMRNFVATQSFEWGKGDRDNTPQAITKLEVQVIRGYQRWRDLPDGKKELNEVPSPPLNNYVVPGGEWSEMPDLVGNNLKLRINRAPDITVNGETFQVFQWRGEVEDGVCRFKTISDFDFISYSKIDTLDCYGEVWTDKDLNIVRASENYKLIGRWKKYRGEVTFGTAVVGEQEFRIPVTISTQVEDAGKLYWCQGLFTDYRRFGSTVRIGNPAIGSAMDAAKPDKPVEKEQ